jgi:hypothetical protein
MACWCVFAYSKSGGKECVDETGVRMVLNVINWYLC